MMIVEFRAIIIRSASDIANKVTMQQPLNPRRPVPPQRRARLYGFVIGVILFAILVSIPVYINNYAPSAFVLTKSEVPATNEASAGEPEVVTVLTVTLTPTLAVLAAEPAIETIEPPTATTTNTPIATDTATPEPTLTVAAPTATISATAPLTITNAVTVIDAITTTEPTETITATTALTPTLVVTVNRLILLPTPTASSSDPVTATLSFTESITSSLTVTTSNPITD